MREIISSLEELYLRQRYAYLLRYLTFLICTLSCHSCSLSLFNLHDQPQKEQNFLHRVTTVTTVVLVLPAVRESKLPYSTPTSQKSLRPKLGSCNQCSISFITRMTAFGTNQYHIHISLACFA